MSYDNLADFLSELEDEGELVRISPEVNSNGEIAEVTRRVCQSSDASPALLFDNVAGQSIPVVTNLLGSEKRLCKALAAKSFDEVAQRLITLVRPELPESWLDSLKLVPNLAQLTKLPPKTVKTGLCQQVVKMGSDVNLSTLPVPKSWPQESNPCMTAAQVFTQHPETGVRNVGLYPVEILSDQSVTIHWNSHNDGFEHWQSYREKNRQMPVAIVLGGNPVHTLMAAAPLPPATDECLLGSILSGKNLELVKCRSHDLEVPAFAEIVLEGFISAETELDSTGPIALPTGFASVNSESTSVQITAVTHRANPVFPSIVFGQPVSETDWLARACERIMLPFVRLYLPEIVDVHRPFSGASRNILFVSINKTFPQQAQKVMNALWSLKSFMTTKLIVVVDKSVPVQSESAVWFAAGAHVHPGRDVIFNTGPGDMLDHAAPAVGLGHKMGIDATEKLSAEGHPRTWPDLLAADKTVERLVKQRWQEYGLEKILPAIKFNDESSPS